MMRRMTRPAWAALAVAALLAMPPVFAQRASGYAAAAAGQLKPLSAAQRLERRFLQIAAANLRFQGEASLLARARSNNPAVKELAHALLARQQATQPEILHLLQARGMAPPILGNEHNKVLKQLGKASGAKFDRIYVEDVVLRSHQADVANFEKVAAQAEDPVLKAWVERELPALRLQLEQAQRTLPGATARGRRAL
jgi:putative membrane protein